MQNTACSRQGKKMSEIMEIILWISCILFFAITDIYTPPSPIHIIWGWCVWVYLFYCYILKTKLFIVKKQNVGLLNYFIQIVICTLFSVVYGHKVFIVDEKIKVIMMLLMLYQALQIRKVKILSRQYENTDEKYILKEDDYKSKIIFLMNKYKKDSDLGKIVWLLILNNFSLIMLIGMVLGINILMLFFTIERNVLILAMVFLIFCILNYQKYVLYKVKLLKYIGDMIGVLGAILASVNFGFYVESVDYGAWYLGLCFMSPFLITSCQIHRFNCVEMLHIDMR